MSGRVHASARDPHLTYGGARAPSARAPRLSRPDHVRRDRGVLPCRLRLVCSTWRVEWRLLAGLPEADRRRVLSSALTLTFAAGEMVFAEGAPGDALHLLSAGHVAIRVGTPGGEVATLTIVSPGEAFGEMALLRRTSTRTATAVALDKVTTLALDSGVFHQMRAEHPSVERLLVAVLAARVNRLSGHLVDALYLPVDKRVPRRLLELCRIYGVPGASRVVIPLTQEDLAGLAGTTRPTVNALLRALQDVGTIALSRGRIEVLDADALATAAGP